MAQSKRQFAMDVSFKASYGTSAQSDTELVMSRRRARQTLKEDKEQIERGLRAGNLVQDLDDMVMHGDSIHELSPTYLLPRGEALSTAGLGDKVEVRASRLSGVGVFATDTMEPKDIATEYGGGPIWSAKEDDDYPRGTATKSTRSEQRDIVEYDITQHYTLRKPYPFFKPMSSREFRSKFQVVTMIGDGLCFFHCIAYARREDTRPTQAAVERDRFLRQYRDLFKGRRNEIPIMRMATDDEWDDMERRVGHPSSESGFPNHLTIFMAQEIFNIIIYVWSRRSQRQYHVTLAPSGRTSVEAPRFVLHILHDKDNLHYDVLLPKKEYVKPVDLAVDITEDIAQSRKEPVCWNIDLENDDPVNNTDANNSDMAARPNGLVYSDVQDTFADDDEEWTPYKPSASHLSTRYVLKHSQTSSGGVQSVHFTTPGSQPMSRTSSCTSDRRATGEEVYAEGSTKRIRPSHTEFMRLMPSDQQILADINSELTGEGTRRCCDRGCIVVSRRSDDCIGGGIEIGPQLSSQVFPDIWSALRNSRCHQARQKYSCHERNLLLFDEYRQGLHVTSAGISEEAPSTRYNMYIENYCSSTTGHAARMQVCLRAFKIFHSIPRATHARFLSQLRAQGPSAVLPSQVRKAEREIKKSSPECRSLSEAHMLCVAFIRNHCKMFGERMPNMNKIRIAFPKKIVYDAYCSTFACAVPEDDPTRNDRRPGKPVDISTFYRLWENYCAHIEPNRWKGDFLVCDKCKEHATIDCRPKLSEEQRKENRLEFQRHLKTVQDCRQEYYAHIDFSSVNQNSTMSIIMDGCDSNTTVLPSLHYTSKAENRWTSYALKHKLMGVRVHGLRNRDYLYMAGPHLGDAVGTNYTVECLARTLKKEADFRRANGLRWPHTLYLQLDNTSKENKNQHMFQYLSYLVQRGVFKVIEVNFLPVGHTHEDIDQLFSVLTRRLRQVSVFTFPQWCAEMEKAVKDPKSRITSIDYVWAVRDYKKWFEPAKLEGYQDYRSKVYHFYLIQESPQSPPVCYYQKYGYQVQASGRKPEPDSGLRPASWLDASRLQTEEPEVDATAGTWKEAKEISSAAFDYEDRLHGIVQLLRQRQNQASEEDIEWWRLYFQTIPRCGTKQPTQDQVWTYELPDVCALNDGAGAHAIDIFALDNVEPEAAPVGPILLMKGLTKSLRRNMQQNAIDKRDMTVCQSVEKNQFVIFRIGEDWNDIAQSTAGMNAAATSWGFMLGKVERAEPIRAQDGGEGEEEAMIAVQVWYPISGNPNGKWTQWRRRHDDNTHSIWIKEIPQHSIAVTDVGFVRKGTTFDKKTKMAICGVPDLYLSYVPKVGIARDDVAIERLQARVEETKIAYSKKAIREQKTAETLLRNAVNTKRIKTLTMTPGTALSRPNRIAKSKALSYKDLVSDSDEEDLKLKASDEASNYSDDDGSDFTVGHDDENGEQGAQLITQKAGSPEPYEIDY